MKKTIKLYLAMESYLVAKGFDSLINSSLKDENYEIESLIVNEKEDLSEISFAEIPETQNILIFDCSLIKAQNKLFIYNLLKSYQKLKVIVLAKTFDYSEIKMLFNIGIMGVIDEKISPNDFLNVFQTVLNGGKATSNAIKNNIIEKYCQNEKIEINQNLQYEEVNYAREIFSLTEREKEVLNLICNGKNTREISEQLFISTHTAETHRRHLLGKLDVKNTAEMVKIAVLNKLIPIN